jgi:hypothetical protein
MPDPAPWWKGPAAASATEMAEAARMGGARQRGRLALALLAGGIAYFTSSTSYPIPSVRMSPVPNGVLASMSTKSSRE